MHVPIPVSFVVLQKQLGRRQSGDPVGILRDELPQIVGVPKPLVENTDVVVSHHLFTQLIVFVHMVAEDHQIQLLGCSLGLVIHNAVFVGDLRHIPYDKAVKPRKIRHKLHRNEIVEFLGHFTAL